MPIVQIFPLDLEAWSFKASPTCLMTPGEIDESIMEEITDSQCERFHTMHHGHRDSTELHSMIFISHSSLVIKELR